MKTLSQVRLKISRRIKELKDIMNASVDHKEKQRYHDVLCELEKVKDMLQNLP